VTSIEAIVVPPVWPSGTDNVDGTCTSGGESSSVIVPTPSPSSMVAPVAPVSLRENVSSTSSSESPTIVTETVLFSFFPANRRVPERDT
jgi:hypothetical protein